MQNNLFHTIALTGVSTAAILCAGPAFAIQDQEEYNFNIPSQGLGAALNAFGRASKQQVVFDGALVRGKKSVNLVGDFPASDALDKMLRGTGLQAEQSRNGIFIIRAVSDNTMSQMAQTDASSSQENASGEEASSFVLEEIIVTATKRSESLQDVPVAISALTTQAIEKQGIENFADFARQVPGVIKNDDAKNFGIFTIRGIATANFALGPQVAVATYIDEMPVSGGARLSADMRLYDVERIEILRGPQGTLFGSGTLSGAVRVITNKADPSGFDASASVDFGLTGSDSFRQRYNAMVNVPLVEDKLAVRAVAYYRHEEGYVDNIGIGVENSNTNEDIGGRVSVRWTPTDRLTTTFGVLYEDSDPKDFQFFDPTLGRNIRSTRIADFTALETTNYSAVLEYDFDWASLTSSTTYSEAITHQITDLSGLFGDAAPYGVGFDENSEAIAQEIRLVSTTDSDLEWVIGGFYFDRDRDIESGLFSYDDFLEALNITGLPASVFAKAENTSQFTHAFSLGELREMAVFGELSYRLSDELKLTVGLRYGSSESTNTTFGDKGFDHLGAFWGAAFGGGNQEVPLGAVAPNVFGSGKRNKLTKKFSITWQPTDEQTYYALASEGFRIDTPNNRSNNGISLIDPTDIVIPQSSKSDTLWNYELGAKTHWFDRRVKANVAFYYVDWKNIQVQANRLSDGASFFTNVGAAVSKGMELEMQAWPSDAVELGLNLTLQDAEITSLTEEEAAISGAVKGHPLASPDFQLSGYIQHTWQLNGGQELYARVDAQHMGGFPSGFPNVAGDPDQVNSLIEDAQAHEYVGASIGWTTDNWSLVLYGENLLNDDSYIFIHPQSFLPNRYGIMRPRTFGIRASWKY